jgi:hypothetical protein
LDRDRERDDSYANSACGRDRNRVRQKASRREGGQRAGRESAREHRHIRLFENPTDHQAANHGGHEDAQRQACLRGLEPSGHQAKPNH